MSEKIKLEVNHKKHSKKKSGAKMKIPPQQQNIKEEKESFQYHDISSERKSEKIKKSKDRKQKKSKKQKKNKKRNENETIESIYEEQIQQILPEIQQEGDQEIKQKNLRITEEKQNKVNKDQNKTISKSKQQKQNNKINQFQTINCIKTLQKKTKDAMQQLINQYKKNSEDIFVNHGYNPQKQALISEKLQKLQKDKQKRHKFLKEVEQKEKQQKYLLQSKKQQNIQIKKKRQNQKKIKRISAKINKIQKQAQKRAEQGQNYKHHYKLYQRKIPTFKRYENQFEEKQKQQRQQYIDKLMKIKNKHKSLDLDHIFQFQSNYMDQKQESIMLNNKKHQLEQKMLKEQNKRFKSLWKGQCHQEVKRQIIDLKKLFKKEDAKKKMIKIKRYDNIIKENYQSQKKYSDEEDQELSTVNEEKKNNKRHRQKYLKGINYGTIEEQIRQPLSHDEKITKGNEYLQFLKKLPKKEKISTKNPELQYTKQKHQTYKLKKKSNPYYKIEYSNQQLNLENYHSVTNSLDKIHKGNDITSEQKVLKHGNYKGIIQVQDKQNTINKHLLKNIQNKLALLSRIP